MSSERSDSTLSGTTSVLDRIQFSERLSTDSSHNSSVIVTSQQPQASHWTGTITSFPTNAGKFETT